MAPLPPLSAVCWGCRWTEQYAATLPIQLTRSVKTNTLAITCVRRVIKRSEEGTASDMGNEGILYHTIQSTQETSPSFQKNNLRKQQQILAFGFQVLARQTHPGVNIPPAEHEVRSGDRYHSSSRTSCPEAEKSTRKDKPPDRVQSIIIHQD